jgi:hypothetical protein
MARDRANINTNLWVDPDWRDLDDAEQRLYMLLTTHPSLSYAGVADWRPGRLAAMSRNGSREGIELAAKGLQAKRFVFIDEGTEEILIRSFLRHDGLLKQPKLAVSMANAFGAVASREIQMIIVNELQRLNTEHPDWKAFEVAQVKVLLKLEGKDMANFTHRFTPSFTPKPAQAQALPTATTTSTTTSTVVEGSGESRKKPASRLSASWAPNEAHTQYAATEGIALDFQAERFRTHAEANDRRIVNWDAAFKNWLLKAERKTATKPAANSPWNKDFYK